jgi:hypothetical protein
MSERSEATYASAFRELPYEGALSGAGVAPAARGGRNDTGAREDGGLPGLLERHIAALAARLWQRLPEAEVLEVWMRRSALDGRLHDPGVTSAAAADLAAALEGALLAPDNASDPLAVLAAHYELSPFEIDLLLLSAVPAIDERFGSLFERITAGRRRLRVSEAAGLLLAPDTDRLVVANLLGRTSLWRSGLLRDPGDDADFERLLDATPGALALLQARVPPALADGSAVRHRRVDELDKSTSASLPELDELADTVAAWAIEVGPSIVHAVTSDAEAGRVFATAVATACGRSLTIVEPAAAVTSTTLREAALVARAGGAVLYVEACASAEAGLASANGGGVDASTHGTIVAVPRHWSPPAITIVSAPAGRSVEARSIPARRLDLPAPSPATRAAAWRRHLDEHGATADVDLLACRTHLSIEAIRRACRLAAERARLEGRPTADHDDVVAALREVAPDPVSTLATTYRPAVPWGRVVLPAGARGQADELVQRVRLRATMAGHAAWNVDGLGRRGDAVVALLHGVSGGGKTLLAEAIATRLQLPIVAADLSRIVSKYIGETEKNLSGLFAVAEGYRAVLLFDEADALFGKRTGVSDAHDRYANIEVNFLLQRMETFTGVALLCTNLMQNTDEALLRRLQFTVHVPRPTPGEQIVIWRHHLPAAHLVADDVDVEELVTRFDLVGGDICNAAKSAAYAAAGNGGRITREILLEAVRAELKKRGRPVPRK